MATLDDPWPKLNNQHFVFGSLLTKMMRHRQSESPSSLHFVMRHDNELVSNKTTYMLGFPNQDMVFRHLLLSNRVQLGDLDNARIWLTSTPFKFSDSKVGDGAMLSSVGQTEVGPVNIMSYFKQSRLLGDRLCDIFGITFESEISEDLIARMNINRARDGQWVKDFCDIKMEARAYGDFFLRLARVTVENT